MNLFKSCMLLLFLTFTACKSKHIASKIVQQKINNAKKVLLINESDNKREYVETFIAELSQINCKDGIVLGHNDFCIPSEVEIKKWEKWYVENKGDFFLNPNYKCFKTLRFKKRDRMKVVFLVNKTGDTINSLTYDQKWTCNQLTKMAGMKKTEL